uniref:Inter-alpha (Globulin) inhibitor H2 n=1 Tax=Nothobranchius furzeri TaxID=105023 RepID=A0A1A8UR80_NOTFU
MEKSGVQPFSCYTDPATLGPRWTRWLTSFELFADGKGLILADDATDAVKQRRRALLLHLAGQDVQDVFSTLPRTGGAADYAAAVTALNTYFVPQVNAAYARQTFHKLSQTPGETVQQFCTRLRRAAKDCDFQGDNDNQIRDAILNKCTSEYVRRKLLEEGPGLTLTRALEVASHCERVEEQMAAMSGTGERKGENTVSRIFTAKKEKNHRPRGQMKDDAKTDRQCYRCGYTDHRGKDPKCPARGQTCHKCNGEIKLSTIQKNVKRVMREEFSLFSLGIGFDVDYDFLERIAMENRGMAQRIYANHDAGEQLRAFYKQISSPILRKIGITFPEDAVANVTQKTFDKYFNGSELVVAGRVLPSAGDTLISLTSAMAYMDITLQTEADMTKLDMQLNKQQHSFAGFAKQMWAYLTIKQLISERSLAPTAARKRKLTQRITALSLDHQFVTPLTALLVESEDGRERLLADSPRDPKQGCCSGVMGPSKVNMVYATPPTPPWVHATTSAPKQAQKGDVVLMTLPPIVMRVDDDPHFIVHLPRRNLDVCFNIDSKPGHILSLVSDPGTGVVVNGQLISTKQVQKNKLRTYFGVISVFYQPEGVSVTISTDRITMTHGKNRNLFTWRASAEISQHGVRISIVRNSHVIITVTENIQVEVMLHRVWRNHPVNVDFLGIYLPNNNQYSPLAHGLIGQFSQEPEMSLYDIHEGADPLKKEATMEVKGNKLLVTRYSITRQKQDGEDFLQA